MTGPLIDGFGRVVDDLRVSVTDRCNFRCTYCMPAEGLAWLPKAEILTYEEIARLVRVFAGMGVHTVRLTGGEPLARRDLPKLVEQLSSIGDLDLALTTNGTALDKLAAPLARAGLKRINVSLDSLLPHRFAEMTRRDALDQVLRGIQAAADAGLDPVKINCVVVAGTNDDEVVDFARMSRETGHQVRFIEFMPLDAEEHWSAKAVLPSAEVLRRISAVFPLEPVAHGPEPARVYRFADGAPGGVGVISSVSEPFCESCNRVRITPDGQLRVCLFALEETDLRSIVRGGGTDADIEEAIRAAASAKWAGHHINKPDFARPKRSMSMIGG
jgi:GTP 3',8-cyclase